MHAVDCEFSFKCIKALVELGCDINHKDNEGMTALSNCYSLEQAGLFKQLIVECGASPDKALRKEINEDGN